MAVGILKHAGCMLLIAVGPVLISVLMKTVVQGQDDAQVDGAHAPVGHWLDDQLNRNCACWSACGGVCGWVESDDDGGLS